jgi:nucleoside-diphosphate-sugar epimerase
MISLRIRHELSYGSDDEYPAIFAQTTESRALPGYCFVYDLADAIVRACCLDIPGSVLNIGSGTGTSVAEIARTALKLRGRDIPIRQCEVSDRPAHSDITLLIANLERADSTLQWRTKTTLEEGLMETMQWLEATGYSS